MLLTHGQAQEDSGTEGEVDDVIIHNIL